MEWTICRIVFACSLLDGLNSGAGGCAGGCDGCGGCGVEDGGGNALVLGDVDDWIRPDPLLSGGERPLALSRCV